METKDTVTRELRENAWKYFEIHAAQRLRLFQFYITISAALLGGSYLLVKQGANELFLLLIGLFSSFFSFIFWKLDIRTRNLVKNAEQAIQFLDDQIELPDTDGAPSPLKLFARDEHMCETEYARHFLGHFSYRKCFEYVFVVVGGLGLLAAALGVFRLLG